MTSIYDVEKEERERLEKVGVDYSLSACLEYNPQSFDLQNVEKVLAVWEGEHDGDDWRWVIKVNSVCSKKNGGRFVFLQGGCDYTGWDCQSWATSEFATTALNAAKFSNGKGVHLGKSSPDKAGFGHMLNILSGDYMKNYNEVYSSLTDQLKSAKNKTWHEKKDVELGTSGLDKINA